MAKRRFTKRRRTTKRARKGRKIARVSTVKRMIARTEEAKWQCSTLPMAIGFDGPVPQLLNGISQGVTHNSRDGNIVNLKGLEIRMNFTSNLGLFSRFRILVFYDTQTNSGPPDLTTFFAVSPTYTTQTITSPLNPNYWGKRYKLLKDVTKSVGVMGGATDVAQEKQFKLAFRLKSRTQYNDNGAATAVGIIKNALYCFAISDENLVNQPNVTITWLLKWTDS